MTKKLTIKEIAEQTMIGIVEKSFPRENGNCFGVIASDGKHYKIVNFNIENLKEAIKRGVKEPIQIKILSKRHALIHDPRIPDSWYSSGFCEVCCPKSLLPYPQKLRHERQIARGERVEFENSFSINTNKSPDLRTEEEKVKPFKDLLDGGDKPMDVTFDFN